MAGRWLICSAPPFQRHSNTEPCPRVRTANTQPRVAHLSPARDPQNRTWNKQKKRDKEEQRILNRHNAEKDEREQVRRDQYESRQRMETTYRTMDREYCPLIIRSEHMMLTLCMPDCRRGRVGCRCAREGQGTRNRAGPVPVRGDRVRRRGRGRDRQQPRRDWRPRWEAQDACHDGRPGG